MADLHNTQSISMPDTETAAQKLHMKRPRARVISTVHFGALDLPGFHVEKADSLTWRHALSGRKIHAIICAIPTGSDLAKIFVLKILSLGRTRIAVFDLILRRPANLRDRLHALLKRLALTSVDLFLMIQRDWSGYARHYGLRPGRCRYIPFKANNLDFAGKLAESDGGYIFSCGASHRDFDTLMRAAARLGHRTIIALTESAAIRHMATFDPALMTASIERIYEPLDRMQYNELIAGARLVVVPVKADVLQPAGISVYLEAMALGKPVVVTRGSSTEGILDESLASLVPAEDPDAMHAALDTLWNNATLRAEMGARGRKFALALQGDARLAADISRHFAELYNRRLDQ